MHEHKPVWEDDVVHHHCQRHTHDRRSATAASDAVENFLSTQSVDGQVACELKLQMEVLALMAQVVTTFPTAALTSITATTMPIVLSLARPFLKHRATAHEAVS